MIDRTNRTDAATEDYLTPGQAAALCGLSAYHLARMANAGKLTAAKPGGSHRRYLRSEVEALAKPVRR